MITIDLVAKAIETAMDKIKSPASILPAELLYCIALKRSGTSGYRAASEVIAGLSDDGINSGKNPDGTDNIVNKYTYRIVNAVLKEIKENGSVMIAVPRNSIVVQTTGANAGGTLTGFGSNVVGTVLRGIFR